MEGRYIFSNYTVHLRHSQRTHTHPYEYMHANPTPRSIFEDCVGKSSRLTKSTQAPRCRRECSLPLKAQTPLNPEKFAPTESRIQDHYVKTSNRSRNICNGPLTPVKSTHICNGCCLAPVTYKRARTTSGLASTPVTNVDFW
jgi:hypothetical protein